MHLGSFGILTHTLKWLKVAAKHVLNLPLPMVDSDTLIISSSLIIVMLGKKEAEAYP